MKRKQWEDEVVRPIGDAITKGDMGYFRDGDDDTAAVSSMAIAKIALRHVAQVLGPGLARACARDALAEWPEPSEVEAFKAWRQEVSDG